MVWLIGCCGGIGAKPVLPQNFQIIDSDDQLRLIKRLIKNLEIDDSRWPYHAKYSILSTAQKDEGLQAQASGSTMGDPSLADRLIDLYKAYEEVCDRGGLVDFAELLLRAH